jgi:four helix bundle protein
MENGRGTLFDSSSEEKAEYVFDLAGKYGIDLSQRLIKFAVNIIRFLGTINYQTEFEVFRNQLSRCGTSIGANFEEACGATSKKDFVSKLYICLKESRETDYWLRILTELNLGEAQLRTSLSKESLELIKIFISSIKTAKKNLK